MLGKEYKFEYSQAENFNTEVEISNVIDLTSLVVEENARLKAQRDQGSVVVTKKIKSKKGVEVLYAQRLILPTDEDVDVLLEKFATKKALPYKIEELPEVEEKQMPQSSETEHETDENDEDYEAAPTFDEENDEVSGNPDPNINPKVNTEESYSESLVSEEHSEREEISALKQRFDEMEFIQRQKDEATKTREAEQEEEIAKLKAELSARTTAVPEQDGEVIFNSVFKEFIDSDKEKANAISDSESDLHLDNGENDGGNNSLSNSLPDTDDNSSDIHSNGQEQVEASTPVLSVSEPQKVHSADEGVPYELLPVQKESHAPTMQEIAELSGQLNSLRKRSDVEHQVSVELATQKKSEIEAMLKQKNRERSNTLVEARQAFEQKNNEIEQSYDLEIVQGQEAIENKFNATQTAEVNKRMSDQSGYIVGLIERLGAFLENG